mgnify:CR=1 FL=1
MKTLSRENKTFIGYIIIGICLVALGASVVSAIVLKGEPHDPETFCPMKISAHTIVVLDKTDVLSPGQQKFVLDYIDKERDKLGALEKFSVFTLTENLHLNLEPVFSKCNPGTGKDANPLYQNPRKIQLRFDKLFADPLKEDVSGIFADGTSQKSPIFEMIRELTYRADFGEDVGQRKLIILSDMMQHTPEYSHYKSRPDYSAFVTAPYSDEVSANLYSVDVQIVYLLRDTLGKAQGKQHLKFWNEYLAAMGAGIVEVRNIR